MKKEILIVDDDRKSLDALASFLKYEGFEVRTASDGADALKCLLASLPDIILSDIRMPKIDGFTLAKQIRSNPQTQLLPIIFITGFDAKTNRIEGFRNGIDAYITKPIDFDELKVVIENILTRIERTKNQYAELIDVQNRREPETFIESLTETENKIAAAVARGLSNKEIAEEFNNSVRTIENHISNILSKKNLHNRVEIARLVLNENGSEQ